MLRLPARNISKTPLLRRKNLLYHHLSIPPSESGNLHHSLLQATFLM